MPISLICKSCGSEFKVTPNRSNAKFCSHACALSWNHKYNPKYLSWEPPCKKGEKRRWSSPGTKGKHHSEETKRKISLSNKGKNIGKSTWNKDGKTWIEYFGEEKALEIRLKMSKNRKGLTLGDKHPNWKGGTTPLRIREVKRRYKDVIFQIERKKAFERDNYMCQDCGVKPEKPIAHHIIPYPISKDHSAKNLLTVCCKCHTKHDAGFRKSHKVKQTISNVT